MATEDAIPKDAQEKTHGDELDHVIDSVLDEGTGLSQEPAGKTHDREPAKEPLK